MLLYAVFIRFNALPLLQLLVEDSIASIRDIEKQAQMKINVNWLHISLRFSLTTAKVPIQTTDRESNCISCFRALACKQLEVSVDCHKFM